MQSEYEAVVATHQSFGEPTMKNEQILVKIMKFGAMPEQYRHHPGRWCR